MVSVNGFSKGSNILIKNAKYVLGQTAHESFTKLLSTEKYVTKIQPPQHYCLDWITLDGLKTFRNKVAIELTNTPLIIFGPNGSGKTTIALAIHYSLCGLSALRRQKISGSSFFSNRSLGDKWISLRSQFVKSQGKIQAIQINRMLRKRASNRVDSLAPFQNIPVSQDQQLSWNSHQIIRTPEKVNRFIAKSLGLNLRQDPSALLDLSEILFFHEKPNLLISRKSQNKRWKLLLWGSGHWVITPIYMEIEAQLKITRKNFDQLIQKQEETERTVALLDAHEKSQNQRLDSNLEVILDCLKEDSKSEIITALHDHSKQLSIKREKLESKIHDLEQIQSFLSNEIRNRTEFILHETNNHFTTMQTRVFNFERPFLTLEEFGNLNIDRRSKFDDFSAAEQKILEILFRIAMIITILPENGFLLLETPSEDLDQEYKHKILQELMMASKKLKLILTETNPKFTHAMKRVTSAKILDLTEYATLAPTRLEQTSLDTYFEDISFEA